MRNVFLLCGCAIILAVAGGCQREPSRHKDANATERSEQSTAAAEEQEDRWAEERRSMVKFDIARRSPQVQSERVLDAMRTVPRHEFVLPEYRDRAYSDTPLPIGHDQTISQPYIVALMTDRLEPESDDRVLEVGTGSGYQAAVLSELCEEVYTVEIVEGLAEQARKRLEKLGYDKVHVRHGDGFYGWKKHAPFDAIIVTAAPEELPQRLLDQLKPGGRMVIPVGEQYGVQRLQTVTKTKEGEIRRQMICPVRFVPMTGQMEKVE